MEEIEKEILKNNEEIEKLQSLMEKNYKDNWDVKYIILVILGVISIIAGINLKAFIGPIISVSMIVGGFTFSLVVSIVAYIKDNGYRKLDKKMTSLIEENKFLNFDMCNKKVKKALISKKTSKIDEDILNGATKEGLISAIKAYQEQNKVSMKPKQYKYKLYKKIMPVSDLSKKQKIYKMS